MYFDTLCMTRLARKPKGSELYSLLKARGAGEKAYMLTRLEKFDGRIVPLLDALAAVIGQCAGDFIYCFDGQVGYYEADGWEGFFIIHKPEKATQSR